MIETICPTCGSERLLPDPPPKSKEESIQFRKDWDAWVEAAQQKGATA